MKATLRILTQYKENYGFSEGKFAWKNKGGQEFTVQADSQTLMFGDEDDRIAAIKIMLEEQSNDLCKFEYVSHELLFEDPIVLDSEKFEKLLDECAVKSREQRQAQGAAAIH